MKEIEITIKSGNKVMEVDDEDYDNLKQYKWYFDKNYGKNGMPYANIIDKDTKKVKYVFIKKLLFPNLEKNKVVDYLGEDPFNCKKTNFLIRDRKYNAIKSKKVKKISTSIKFKFQKFIDFWGMDADDIYSFSKELKILDTESDIYSIFVNNNIEYIYNVLRENSNKARVSGHDFCIRWLNQNFKFNKDEIAFKISSMNEIKKENNVDLDIDDIDIDDLNIQWI